MKFRFGFSGQFQSSTIFRMVNSRTNTLITTSMLNNKYFHDTVRAVVSEASASCRKQLSISKGKGQMLDLVTLGSLSGLGLMQLIKAMPIINMLTILSLISSSNDLIIFI